MRVKNRKTVIIYMDTTESDFNAQTKTYTCSINNVFFTPHEVILRSMTVDNISLVGDTNIITSSIINNEPLCSFTVSGGAAENNYNFSPQSIFPVNRPISGVQTFSFVNPYIPSFVVLDMVITLTLEFIEYEKDK